MIELTDWLDDIRIEDAYMKGQGRIYKTAAMLLAWAGISSMHKDWFGTPPYKIMVF